MAGSTSPSPRLTQAVRRVRFHRPRIGKLDLTVLIASGHPETLAAGLAEGSSFCQSGPRCDSGQFFFTLFVARPLVAAVAPDEELLSDSAQLLLFLRQTK